LLLNIFSPPYIFLIELQSENLLHALAYAVYRRISCGKQNAPYDQRIIAAGVLNFYPFTIIN